MEIVAAPALITFGQSAAAVAPPAPPGPAGGLAGADPGAGAWARARVPQARPRSPVKAARRPMGAPGPRSCRSPRSPPSLSGVAAIGALSFIPAPPWGTAGARLGDHTLPIIDAMVHAKS